MHKTFQNLVIAVAVLTVCLSSLAGATVLQTPAVSGQSHTLLADGRTLDLGGLNAQGKVLAEAFISGSGVAPQKLAGTLHVARAGHSATLLPDGTVFIFGGIGADGNIVATAELFDPVAESFSVLADVLAVPRAFHTATLLTDGSVLLAGGVEAGNAFPDDVQLWDFRTRRAVSQHALLGIPREGQSAVLMADGSVRMNGGTDHFGRHVAIDEIYDPVTKRFRFVGSDVTKAETSSELQIAASVPENLADNVPIDALISLRFSRLVNVTSVSTGTMVLRSVDGTIISTKVIAAESGRLAFVLPSAPLQPGTSYSLRIKGVSGPGGLELPETSLTFTTAGEPPANPGADWTPNSTWTDPAGTTQFQQLEPLQAPAGVTALAGQVLKLNGWPLRQVTLEMDGKKTRTDDTGRFLLQSLTAGHHVLWIDGGTANESGASYGIYEVGVTVLPNKTNVLNYTIWMTRLDTAHAVKIASPTKTEMVITNPALPGLELHLPAGTVITDRFGKVVREVSITAIPLDKPPFPLPAGVQVPLYFTIQPGGAYIKVLGTGPVKGALLIYPNASNLKPGAPFEFWNYDADARGWYIYGNGRVSADARSIIPDPGVVIYEFTGAMVGTPTQAPGTGNPAGSPKEDKAGDPVNLSTGQFTYEKTDLALPDTMPVSLSRTYITNDSRSRSFGIGFTNAYDVFMVGDISPYTYQELVLPDGGRIRFDRVTAGTNFVDAVYVHNDSRTAFYGAKLIFTSVPGIPGPWQLTMRDGTTLYFPEAPGVTNAFCQALVGIKDRYGNQMQITRVPNTCFLAKVTSPNGRFINLTTDTQGHITQAVDSIGRTVSYTYDAAGRLSTVTDPNNGITTYTYDDQNRMLTIRDARNILYLTNHYDSAGRVDQQTNADTGTYLFHWTPTGNTTQFLLSFGGTTVGNGGGAILFNSGCWNGVSTNRYSSACTEGYLPLVAQVDVTDPRGYIRRVVFGKGGYKTSDTYALGQPEQQTTTYQYYADNLLKSVTDALGRIASFDYDGLGNTTRMTLLDGTPNAITVTSSYGGPFNGLTSITDPLGYSSSFAYDSQGNLTSSQDALNHLNTFAYNAAGQLTAVTDALNNTVQLGYFAGDPLSVTDPMGNVGTSFTDAVGRVVSATDALGNTVKYQYNNLNLLTHVTDARGSDTSFSYDGNGNLLSLTDALQHPTTYTYDNMDRVQARTDPLLRQESYNYDLNGNLVSSTDRKGQVTSFSYDPLNRLKFVGFNTVVNGTTTTYESTISYTYDAGNRMTQAVDTAGGTITHSYDNLDRLISETTPQGSISYGYDAAGRPTTMQVTGQPQVSYNYDNANRLTQISQGASTAGFSYDNANRRTALTLSNGVNTAYSYDNASRVTGITYNFNTNTLGNLTYSYDQLGRRTQVGGSFARTGLPGAVTSAVYDAANELTNWNGTAISYDADGNMLSDGSNVFTWNSRNQVASLNSVSLQYDAFGRRTRNAAGTSFFYNGANAIQELSGSTITANLIGGGIDEFFTRTDSSGSFTPLVDALGSTIGLVDSSGNIRTSYSYDPFGNTSTSGAASSNPSQYSGRENEGNGLYYYRARYYSSLLGRFISPDPIGFRGGINPYAYVLDSPGILTDPFGLESGNLNRLVPGPNGETAPNTPLTPEESENLLNAMVGRKTVEVNRCAAELSQYGSISHMSGGLIPEFIGGNTFGDISALTFNGPNKGAAAAGVGIDMSLHAGTAATEHVVVGSLTSIGIPISYFPGVYNPITRVEIPLRLGQTAVGETAIAAVEAALAVKALLDAGVYVGALVDCSLEPDIN